MDVFFYKCNVQLSDIIAERSKLKESAVDPDELTPEMQLNVDTFAYYSGYYKKFKRYKLRCFDKLGNARIIDKKTGKEEIRNGREFLQETYAFFENKRLKYYNGICGEIKLVIDEYDAKFSPFTPHDPMAPTRAVTDKGQYRDEEDYRNMD